MFIGKKNSPLSFLLERTKKYSAAVIKGIKSLKIDYNAVKASSLTNLNCSKRTTGKGFSSLAI